MNPRKSITTATSVTSVHPISDLRKKTSAIFNKLANNEKIFLTRNGRGEAVMLSMDTYNGISEQHKRLELAIELLEIEKEIELNPNGINVKKSLQHLQARIQKCLDDLPSES